MKRRPPLTVGETTRTASVRVVIRRGVEDKTGVLVPAPVLANRVAWCAELASSMTAELLAEHWNSADVGELARGVDVSGRTLPSSAWMALRRLGWSVGAPEGVIANDRIVRMAQEQAGRLLRAAHWRAELISGVLATWPADVGKRTAQEWDTVRAAVPGGQNLPSSIIKARTHQIATFLQAKGRLPADVFELEDEPRAAPAAWDAASIPGCHSKRAARSPTASGTWPPRSA